MELLLASVEGDSSLDMLTPEHETKRGDRAKSQCSRAINKVKFEKKKKAPLIHTKTASALLNIFLLPSLGSVNVKKKRKEP